MPRVSILIPAYNAAQYLNDALDSVLRQTFADWEVILVDDGSTDGTGEIAAFRQREFGERLKYVRQTNRGLPAARNTGIRASSGEYIALLDSDDVWLENRLQRSVEALDHDPFSGLAHGRVNYMDANGTILESPRRALKYLSGDISHHIYTRRAHIPVATVTFRRECLHLAGMFDEKLRATEDRDLWFRISQHYSITHIDEVLANYRITPTAMSADARRMREGQLQFLQKYRRNGACSWTAFEEAMALLDRERGDKLFREGRLKNAISCYFLALVRYPLDVGNLYALGRAMAEPLLAVFQVGTRSGRSGV